MSRRNASRNRLRDSRPTRHAARALAGASPALAQPGGSTLVLLQPGGYQVIPPQGFSTHGPARAGW
jgi:hypothetical protein